MIIPSVPSLASLRRSVSIIVAASFFASCGGPNLPADEPASPRASPAEAPPATPAGTPADVAPVSPPSSSAPAPLTEEGWGPLRIGMSRAEVVLAAGEDANPEAVGGPEPDVCDEWYPERAPEGMRVMIERDRLTRITLSEGSSITTEQGLGVGDPAAAVREAHDGDAVVSPHKYMPAPAEYITVWMTAPDAPDARGIVYEVGRDGRVAHVHAGSSSIQYVEGCL